MKKAALLTNVVYGDNRPAINVLFESEVSKEIRIVFRKGQLMKEHKTNFPITVEIVRGEIVFGVNGEKHQLQAGELLALEGGVPHDLLANEDSIVRLTLMKADQVERVEKVVNN